MSLLNYTLNLYLLLKTKRFQLFQVFLIFFYPGLRCLSAQFLEAFEFFHKGNSTPTSKRTHWPPGVFLTNLMINIQVAGQQDMVPM